MATKLLFIRHGELSGESDSVLHAIDDPVSISACGKEQMKAAGLILASANVDMLYASSETRAVESAQILNDILGIPVEFKEELHGRDWGSWAGKEWKEVGEVLGAKTLEERYAYRPPGGECWQEFERRTFETITAIASARAGQTIGIVSHGSLIRVLLPKVFGLSADESLRHYPAYGSVWRVEHDGDVFLNPELGSLA